MDVMIDAASYYVAWISYLCDTLFLSSLQQWFLFNGRFLCHP